MKYIPGFTFVVTNRTSHKGGSILQQQNKLVNRDSVFKTGETYKLYNIRKVEDKFEYHFINNGKSFIIIFDTISDAETRLDKLIGAV